MASTALTEYSIKNNAFFLSWLHEMSLKVLAISGYFFLIFFTLFFHNTVNAEEYFDHYGLSSASPEIDLGTQPLGYPSGVISAVMQRDRILKKILADNSQFLKAHPFRRGADMLSLLAGKRLEAGLLGDMPTLLSASAGNIYIVGLVKQTSTAIVAKNAIQINSLAGKRIAYVEASSAHYTLLEGLASAGMSETQVRLVPMGISDMPDALARGSIDAFSAWEPAPTIAMNKSLQNHTVFRGVSTDYFVLERNFVKQSPQTALHLVAAFVRAIEWMRRSSRHTGKAAIWAMNDTQGFSGKPSPLSVAQIVAIMHREILDIPSAPAILNHPKAPTLQKKFDFLRDLNKLPPGARWENVQSALGYDGLTKVLADARGFQIHIYDYED